MQRSTEIHYICRGGCGGVSDKPGVCKIDECLKHGKPLTKCDCKDGGHHKETKGGEE